MKEDLWGYYNQITLMGAVNEVIGSRVWANSILASRVDSTYATVKHKHKSISLSGLEVSEPNV